MNFCALCVLLLVGLQTLLFGVLGCFKLASREVSEMTVVRLVRWTYSGNFLLACAASVAFLAGSSGRIVIPLGEWISTSQYDFHFVLELDALSVPFLLLATGLGGVITAFSARYLHRDPGFERFFMFTALFGLGDLLTVLAGSVEVLYCAWEMIGLASAMLIAFFHERPGPVRNSLYIFVLYRISDLALLWGTVGVCNLFYNGDFSTFLGVDGWPSGRTSLSPSGALGLGLFFLVAAMGKAGQVPFSGLLPRAMEGPTPSTAIFYGALSVHAGAFLLLRISPMLDVSPLLSGLTLGVGLASAFYATFVGRVQTDVKTKLAYAALAQVGLIFAEIGLGLRVLPVLHCMGHAILRTVQFLQSPSYLHETHELHSAVGDSGLRRPRRMRFYAWAQPKGRLESYTVEPFLRFCGDLRKLDQRVLNWLVGP